MHTRVHTPQQLRRTWGPTWRSPARSSQGRGGDQTCLWTARPLGGQGPHPMSRTYGAATQLPPGTSPPGKRRCRRLDLVAAGTLLPPRRPALSPRTPGLPRRGLAPPAPPTAGCPSKGSCHKQSAPLRGRDLGGRPREGPGRESQRAGSLPEAELSCTRGGYKEGLELPGPEGLPELPAHPGPPPGLPSPTLPEGSSPHPSGLPQPRVILSSTPLPPARWLRGSLEALPR